MSDSLSLLTQAAIAPSPNKPLPPASQVVAALLQAEKAAKQQRLIYPLAPFLGQWQLRFATGTRQVQRRGGIVLGKGFYWPRFTPARLKFQPMSGAIASDANPDEELTITNEVEAVGSTLRFSGPARYLNKKNLLAFDFTHLHLQLGGLTLYRGELPGGNGKRIAFASTSVAKLPFFAFFLVTDTILAARGRGGGLALWARVPSS